MKKFLIASAAILALSLPASAQHRHYHNHGGGHGGGWGGPLVGGLIIGGIVGSVLSQPRYVSPPVVYTDPYPYQQACRRTFVGYDYYGNPVFRTICE